MMQDKFDKRGTTSPFSSPYLDFDPAILRPQNSSQFVVPEGQGETRGKMEMAFFTIGSSVIAGGLFGGINGLYQGLKETRELPAKIRYTQIVNFVGKRGSASSQMFGSVALMFSLYDTLLANVRDVDDELNTVASGVLTGLTYRSPHGLKSMARGGLIGAGLTLAYLSYSKSDHLQAMFKQ